MPLSHLASPNLEEHFRSPTSETYGIHSSLLIMIPLEQKLEKPEADECQSPMN